MIRTTTFFISLLLLASCHRVSEQVQLVQTADEVIVSDRGKTVLVYRISEKMPPEGVDSLYRRSAYIHPLYSPGGAMLTRIQPPDHYHHYGIWGPWTKTTIDGREIDYWNLGKGEGTVRAKAILTAASGRDYAAFTALQEHVDLLNPGGERVTMHEFLEVRYNRTGKDQEKYMVDITSVFRNVTPDTVIFEAYRYGGGLGFRAVESWNGDNSTVMTSEGERRSTADGTRARWCIVEGETAVEAGRSGILFMSHPDNREHPEPMRVWPEELSGGQLLFEFCPIRHREWIILPGRDYTLKYRMVIFDGEFTPEQAETYWKKFASENSSL